VSLGLAGPAGSSFGQLSGSCSADMGADVALTVSSAIPPNNALVVYTSVGGETGSNPAQYRPVTLARGVGGGNAFEIAIRTFLPTTMEGEISFQIGTAQISYGNIVATITATAVDYFQYGADHCDFSVQTTFSKG
jgi:hypothetical protein